MEESVSYKDKDKEENQKNENEGQEEIELNKQMEQTMKILTDSNLNLEDVTTKEDQIKTKNKATLEKKDVESVVEKLKSTKTSMKNLHNE